MNLSTSRLVRSTPFAAATVFSPLWDPALGSRSILTHLPLETPMKPATPGVQISRMRAHSAASAGEFSHCAEQRPGPSNLALEGLREADQIPGITGIELDHAARKK